MIQCARDKFYKSKLSNCTNDPKQTYQVVNKLLDKHHSKTVLPTATSDVEIATKMNSFFKEKVDKIYNEIKSSNLSSTAELSDEHDRSQNTFQLYEFSHIDDNSLTSIIKEMALKHCDLDPLPTKVMVQCLPELLPLLSFIVNTSLKNGIFPSQLKSSILRPSLKKPDLDSEVIGNYRPISNLAFLSKILEKCVFNQLSCYLQSNNLLSKFQSGYRKFHSCETATLRIHNDILVMCDSHNKVLLLLLDLSAAFDTVNHHHLLRKLSRNYGINKSALNWFTSYLSDRSVAVKINTSLSDKSLITIGVPQGSILGPLLFIMYTRDLENIAQLHGFSIHLYADDTQLYFAFDTDNAGDIEARIMACMADMKIWMQINFLKLNENKTEVIIIKPKRTCSQIQQVIRISSEGEEIKLQESVKSLGVHLDSTLSMSSHISAIVQKCNINLRNLWYIGSKLNIKLKIQLVHSLIFSCLDYCNSLLSGITNADLMRLQKVQNQAVRFIYGKSIKKWDHITPFLKSCHFLPVKHRIQFKIALLVYKCINNLAPSYLQELLHVRDPKLNSLRIDDDYFFLKTPSIPSLKSTESAFVFSGPKVWNSLPYQIRCSESIEQFKSKLKTYYFNLVFND